LLSALSSGFISSRSSYATRDSSCTADVQQSAPPSPISGMVCMGNGHKTRTCGMNTEDVLEEFPSRCAIVEMLHT
jgi:hypothetical protein